MSTRFFSFSDDTPFSTEAALVNASSSHYEEDWPSIPHTHAFTELFYVSEGSGEFLIENQRFSIKKDDLIIVNLESIYPELKGKRLRGRLEGRVLKPYDDASTLNSQGSTAKPIAWLTDPMDLQFLQIQGSGRIQLAGGRQLRVGYGDQNGYPYRPIGRWLVEQGELKKEDVTMGAISAWAKAHPQRIPDLLASNPSYVFFSARPDSNEGPRGSLNVPLTAGYSVAVDRKVIPLGSLLWLSTTKPDGTPLARPVAAQDTGGAITGEVRADLFWGTGNAAGELAGNMKQQGQIWMLWPKGAALPQVPDAPAGT